MKLSVFLFSFFFTGPLCLMASSEPDPSMSSRGKQVSSSKRGGGGEGLESPSVDPMAYNSYNKGYNDGLYRRNLALAAFCGSCIDLIAEAKHNYCLTCLSPCENPMKDAVLDLVMIPFCVIGDCCRVESVVPRRKIELDDAVHCRLKEGRIATAVGPECNCLRDNCCTCCVSKSSKSVLKQQVDQRKRSDAADMTGYRQYKEYLKQQVIVPNPLEMK